MARKHEAAIACPLGEGWAVFNRRLSGYLSIYGNADDPTPFCMLELMGHSRPLGGSY